MLRNPMVGFCLRMSCDDVTGGSRLPISRPGNRCRLSPYPLALHKLRLALATPQTVDGPSMKRDLRLLSILPCSIFPHEPGRGLKPWRWQYDRVIHCRRAKRLHCADEVPCGPTAATAKWSFSCGAACLPAPRLDVKGSVFFETHVAAAASSRTLLHNARDTPPLAS